MEVTHPELSFPQRTGLHTIKESPASVVVRLLRPKGSDVFVSCTYQRRYETPGTKVSNHVYVFVPDGEIVPKAALQQHGSPHICSTGSSDSPAFDAYLRTLMNQAPSGAEFISVRRSRKKSFSYDIRDPQSGKKVHWYECQVFFWSRKSTHAVNNVV